MERALELAKRAEQEGEVPVGAVLVRDDVCLAEGWNQTIQNNDPSAHAEMQAIRSAGKKLGNYRLNPCDLYVTLEPCPMCAGAIVQARVSHVYWGASDPKTGALGGRFDLLQTGAIHHQPACFSGLMQAECSSLLKQFFKNRRG